MQNAKRKVQNVGSATQFISPLPSASQTPSPRRRKAKLGSTLEGELSFSQKMTEGGIQNYFYKFKFA